MCLISESGRLHTFIVCRYIVIVSAATCVDVCKDGERERSANLAHVVRVQFVTHTVFDIKIWWPPYIYCLSI
jgi:hypothetical protein